MKLQKNRGKKGFWLILAGALYVGAAVAGCGSNSTQSSRDKSGHAKNDGKQQTSSEKQKKEASIDKEKLKEKGDVSFEADDIQRDPFTPNLELFQTGESVVEKKDRQSSDSPLERHPIQSFSLVALISDVAIPKAMVIGPTGDGYLVRQGMKIGKEGYEITDVQREKLVVELPGDKTEPRTVKLRSETENNVEPEKSTNQELSEEEKRALQKLRGKGAGANRQQGTGNERSVKELREQLREK